MLNESRVGHRQVNHQAYEAVPNDTRQTPSGEREHHAEKPAIWQVYRYGGAVLAVAAATALRWLLQDHFGSGVAFITFYPAVALVAMLAGGGPSLLAVLFSAVVVRTWLGFGTADAGEVLAMGLFIASGLIVSSTAQMLRRARQRVVADLSEQVAMRTRHVDETVTRLRQEIELHERVEDELRVSESRLTGEATALARLNAASERLWRMMDLRDGLDEMLAATIELLGADRGNVQILDADRGVLHIAAQRGFEQPFLDFFREVSVHDDSACGRALRSGARIVIEDVEADAPYAPYLAVARAAGYRGVQSTPLIGRDGVPLGMLSTHWRTPHLPSQQDLRRLDLYLCQAVGFIERCKISQSLREKEERLRLFIEHAPSGLAMFDREMRYLAASRRWITDYRLGEQNIIGRSHYEVFPEIPERWKEVHRRGLAGEVVRAEADRLMRADGSLQWLYWEVRPWHAADGGIGGIVIFTEDITERKQAEQALRASEERLRAILNTAVDAIITINEAGLIQSVNPATEQIFGYAAAELLGENVRLLMPSPYREEHDGYIRRYLETGEARIIGIGREVLGRHKDGRIFPVDLAVSKVDHLRLFMGVVRDITRRKELELEIVEIASLEQRRIGQDLHDTVGQELTGLSLMAETLGDDPALGAELAGRIAKGLSRCQQELRKVLQGLLPVSVDAEGLMAALDDLADRTRRDTRISCAFTCPEPAMVADNLTATHLYLIAKEAVHNAVKHASARSILITLDSRDRLVLRVRDDGIGLSTSTNGHGGVGLRIMRNRAAIIGAALTIAPASPTGTVVTCTMTRMNHEHDRTSQAGEDPHRR